MLVLALVVFGVIMVFSSSYYYALDKKGDAYYYLKRDILWASLGFIGMAITAALPYRVYAKLAPPIVGISILLLALIFTPLGTGTKGATRWLDFGLFTIMPGEVAKLAAIIFTSAYLSKNAKRILSFTQGILPLITLTVIYFGLVIAQPNLSTAITISAIIIGIMFVAGLQWRYLIGIGAMGVLGVIGLIFTDEDGYRMRRITSFLDPFQDPLGSGYQVIQSLLALGSGGLFGVGLGKSIQKTLYLPEPQNDFIFAIIGEELGFIGALLLILCYIILIWRGVHIAINAPELFGMLLASGITIMLAVQVMLNIAVVTSSMPPTGITLPFVSWGGNALLLFMGSMGILINISRHSAR